MIAKTAPEAQGVALPAVRAGATRPGARAARPPEDPATAGPPHPLDAMTARRTAVAVVTVRPTAAVVVTGRTGVGPVATVRRTAAAVVTDPRQGLVARIADTAVGMTGQPQPGMAGTLAAMRPSVGTGMVGTTGAATSRAPSAPVTALRTVAAAIARIGTQRAVHAMARRALAGE